MVIVFIVGLIAGAFIAFATLLLSNEEVHQDSTDF